MENLLEGQPSHPFIGFLVKSVNYATEYLALGNYEMYLRMVFLVFNSLKHEHKNSERGISFFQRLIKVYKARHTPDHHTLRWMMDDPVVSHQNASRVDGVNYFVYYELYDELQSMLHDWKYYEDSTYVGVIAAQTLPKMSPAPVKAPFPERLSEDLR